MIIMISSQGKSIDSQPNPRFGRTSYFIKYDLDKDSWSAFENMAVSQRGGAGVAAAQFLIDHKTNIAISGHFGPNAYQTLNAAGITMQTFNEGDFGSIKDVIEGYKKNQLKEVHH